VRAHARAALRGQAGVPRPLQALARGGRRRTRHRRLPQGEGSGSYHHLMFSYYRKPYLSLLYRNRDKIELIV